LPATAASPLESLIQRADQAFAESRFVGRDGQSASELYQQALAIAPDDERARSGHARSVDYGLRGIEEALTAGQLDLVEQRIEAVRGVAPRNSRLDFLVTQLTRERERVQSDNARRNVADRGQSLLRARLEASTEALRRGALLDPVDDSALSHLRAAERLAPTDPQVVALRATLAAKLVLAADASLAANQIVAARRQLDAAGVLGADAAALERLRRHADQLTADSALAARPATTSAPVVAAAAAPATAPAPPASVPVAAAPTETATPGDPSPEVVSAARLTRLRSVDAEYPTRALVQGLSGWVELEFTVQRNGSVGDVHVRAAEPRGVFDRSAQEALRRWRFAPVVREGKAVEQRAWLRMRFTAQAN
jgi:TonB family protein